MRILFLHPSAPGQFVKLLHYYLRDETNEVAIIHMGSREISSLSNTALERCRVFDIRGLAALDQNQKPYLRKVDDFIRSATAAAQMSSNLKAQGWTPDLVYSHTGFGLGAFVHNIFPDALYVKYCEWFYRNESDGAEFFSGPQKVDNRVGTELLNGPILWDMVRADALISPTLWQRRQFPKHIRESIRIVPDGIDTAHLAPNSSAEFTTAIGKTFRRGDRVVTYVGRGADPFRGYKHFIDALGILQATDPTLNAIIVGDQMAHYGPSVGTNDYFKSVMAEAKIDLDRTHFTGTIPYDDFVKVLQVSAVHVYLTAPFVLSWSALEAMSCGCAIVGSNNGPVWDFIEDEVEGLLAEFDDPQDIASKVTLLCDNERLRSTYGENARNRIIADWNLEDAMVAHMRIIDSAAASRPAISRTAKP